MEGRGDNEASPPADDAARARAGETGVAHRRLNAVVVFLVDLTVKVVSIMFWHNLFSVIRLQWRNLQ